MHVASVDWHNISISIFGIVMLMRVIMNGHGYNHYIMIMVIVRLIIMVRMIIMLKVMVMVITISYNHPYL